MSNELELKLKPCPFCGQPASGGEWPYVPQSDNKQHGMVAVAQCSNRECPVQPDITLFSEGLIPEDTGTWADVLLRWNTRPVEDALRAQWESIPWDEIDGCATAACEDSPDFRDDGLVVEAWLKEYAPEVVK